MIGKIWAKDSGETLSEHTIKCLRAAQSLLDSLPELQPELEQIRESLRKNVLLAVAMHDVGKAATGFQRVLRKEQDNWQGKRHEIISASIASGINGISPIIVFAILTHHKSIPSDGISQVYGCLLDEQIPFPGSESIVWKQMAQEWEDNFQGFVTEWKEVCTYLGWDMTLTKPRPLILHPSWLERSSGRKGQRRIISFLDRYQASIVRGLTITSDHLGSMGVIPSPIPKLSNFLVVKHSPRPFQQHIGKIEGSAILRAPTGSGKTEAALLWAQRNQKPNGRLFYILPYTASINAMHRRLSKVFGDNNVGILHHRATESLYGILEDDESYNLLDRQERASVLANLAREVWFPVRVCTPHQILRYMLRGKSWEYMLAEFPNACFIFDEIHAYDPRVVGLTLGATRLLSQWGAKCLFLSATLPEFLHGLICNAMGELPFVEPDPAQGEDKKILDMKRHIVETVDGSMLDHVETIVQAIHDSPSTLIVCNHVRTAQEFYSLLVAKLELPREQLRLLHSRFNQEDRNRIENSLMNEPLPKVLVATQVVEVSLDLNFAQAFLEPAPIDALIQRMGRVNRSGNMPPAKVVTFTRQANSHNLYCDCQGDQHHPTCRMQLTMGQMHKLENPVSERAMVIAANRVYGTGYQESDRVRFEEGLNHTDIKEFEERLLAGAHQNWVEAIIEQADGVVEVLPLSCVEEYERRKRQGLWIEAHSLLVSIQTKSLGWLRGKLDMSRDPWIARLPYTSDKGLDV